MRAWDSWFANSLKMAMMTPRLMMVMPLVAARQSDVLMKTMELNRARWFSGTVDLFAQPEPDFCVPASEPMRGKVIPFPGRRVRRNSTGITAADTVVPLRAAAK